MSAKKKSRDPNFSDLEVDFLLEHVDGRKNILENKKADNVATKTKKAAWAEIVKEFQENPECQGGTIQQLQTKWKDLKKNAKDAVSAYRKYTTGTGGGPDLPEIFKRIWEMVPGLFERISNRFDDDADIESQSDKEKDTTTAYSDVSHDQEYPESIETDPSAKVPKLSAETSFCPKPSKKPINAPVTYSNPDALKREILEIKKKKFGGRAQSQNDFYARGACSKEKSIG